MRKYLAIAALLSLTSFFLLNDSAESVSENLEFIDKAKKKALSHYYQRGELPKKVDISDKTYLIESTINEKLQKKIKKLLKRYRSDYSAVVVIDNETGHVLASVGYEGRNRKDNYSLPFSSTNPSASLFKIVTSAKLLEEKRVTPDTNFIFRGKGTTLYKYQLREKKSRWNRNVPFKKAFAYSNNVIFGKAAVNHLTGIELFDMAYKMGFNREIIDGIEMPKSQFQMPEGQYNLAELASGFNSETTMSPVHAAALSMTIANGGEFKQPDLFKSVSEIGNQNKVTFDEEDTWRAFGKDTAQGLKQMMVQTVKKGTARGSFRRLKRSLRNKLDIGGKTGSLTGGIPEGKRDWFSSFAVPRGESSRKGISIAVMNINVKKWYVKSAFLAKEIISYYFSNLKPLKAETLVARNSNR